MRRGWHATGDMRRERGDGLAYGEGTTHDLTHRRGMSVAGRVGAVGRLLGGGRLPVCGELPLAALMGEHGNSWRSGSRVVFYGGPGRPRSSGDARRGSRDVSGREDLGRWRRGGCHKTLDGPLRSALQVRLGWRVV